MKERKVSFFSRYFQIFPPTYIPHAENALIKSSHDEGTKERKDYALRGSERMKGKKVSQVLCVYDGNPIR